MRMEYIAVPHQQQSASALLQGASIQGPKASCLRPQNSLRTPIALEPCESSDPDWARLQSSDAAKLMNRRAGALCSRSQSAWVAHRIPEKSGLRRTCNYARRLVSTPVAMYSHLIIARRHQRSEAAVR